MTKAGLVRGVAAASCFLAMSSFPAAAHAQCPDGSPPPCRSAVRTPSAARRLAPALRDRAWIVVPFTNVVKAQELDWLRSGCVNLLALDMGRWTDIDVVPDKRVADLIRALVPASTEALTLEDGLAVARSAGAGRLVMGDFIKSGSGARLVASVFDVRTGAKIRTVTQQAPVADSLLTAFGPLARAVLAVPPPPDAKTGDVGTSQLSAYQAYLLGVKALNRFDLAEARLQLTRALAIDSTFPLAHLQFANLLEWDDLADRALARQHARAALRLGASLPRRERLLIDAGVASADADYARLCDIARTLIAADSTDIQAFFLLGECSFHDRGVVRSRTDTTLAAFRGSWPTAIRAFERVMELDPAYLGAFEHIIDMLQRQRRFGCVDPATSARCDEFDSFVQRGGDTIETVPARTGSAAAERQEERFDRELPTLRSHAQAAVIAQRWVDAAPTSEGAHVGRARAAVMNGDLATADAHFQFVPPRARTDNLQWLRQKLEVAAKVGRGAEARAIFDTIVKLVPDAPAIDVNRGAIELMFGRFTRLDRGLAAASARLGPEAVAYSRHVGRAVLGFPAEGMARDEAAFFAGMRDAACDTSCRLMRLTPTLVFAPHAPVSPIRADSTLPRPDINFLIPVAYASGDTGKMRVVARQMESVARTRTGAQRMDPRSLIAADLYLSLADSASALRMVRYFVDSSMVYMSISSGFIPTGSTGIVGAALWPRAMLLRADLAAAAGSLPEARLWYDRVLSLWADADAELRPVVQRIARARVALGR